MLKSTQTECKTGQTSVCWSSWVVTVSKNSPSRGACTPPFWHGFACARIDIPLPPNCDPSLAHGRSVVVRGGPKNHHLLANPCQQLSTLGNGFTCCEDLGHGIPHMCRSPWSDLTISAISVALSNCTLYQKVGPVLCPNQNKWTDMAKNSPARGSKETTRGAKLVPLAPQNPWCSESRKLYPFILSLCPCWSLCPAPRAGKSAPADPALNP